MLAKHRQSLILQDIRRAGSARVSDLTQRLGVSDMTIRRDLEVLGRAGLAALVTPGTAIALSAGTTTFELARQLREIPRLTIVTNSVRAANLMEGARPAGSGSGRFAVILTGGVRTPSDALVGPIADLVIRSLHFDLLFIGCHGFDPAAGLTTPNLAESETNRAFVRSARRVTVIADHTKWGIVGLSSFADLEDVDTLITDSELPAEARSLLAERVGELVIADGRPG